MIPQNPPRPGALVAAGKRSTTTKKSLPLLAAAFAAGPFLIQVPNAMAQTTTQSTSSSKPAQSHPYVGMWVTTDGHIRHELLPNGRYDEARGSRKSAYQGRYEVSGTHINYWDDTGFTADGTFVDENTLHHGGMIFRREK